MLKQLHYLIATCILTASYSSMAQEKAYESVEEIYEEASEYMANESWAKAYDKLLEVNVNDTSYFDSRVNALVCAQVVDHYDTIVGLCKEVLAVEKYNPRKQTFVNSLGHALIQQEKYDEAWEVLEKGIEEFPLNYIMRYNRSTILVEQKKYDEAVLELQTSIRYNPNYFASHFRLGLLCYQAGDLAKASMALNMALFINATAESSITIISLLENIYGGVPHDGGEIQINYREEEDFEEIDLLIANKVAENPKYKVKVKLGYDFIKHTHLVFESLDYDDDDKGFWNQNYAGFFTQILKDKQYAYFAYYQCIGIDHDPTQKVIMKNKSKVVDFSNYAAQMYLDYMNERIVWEDGGYEKNKFNHVGDYGFDSQGEIVGSSVVGTYKAYTENGLIKTEGQFNNQGQLDGVWKYYTDKGQLEVATKFVNGELKGDRINYYLNGSRSTKMNVQNDHVTGDFYQYYTFNQPYSKITYNSQSQKDGPAEYYYKNGQISDEITHKNDEVAGACTTYHSNGQLKAQYDYVDGEINGHYVSYHRNGQLYEEGEYVDGKLEGFWKIFYDNGQLHYEGGEFRKGYRVGEWKEFTRDGKLTSESNYGETGKKTGIYKEYDLDGKLAMELTYDGEEIVAYKTFNGDGKLMSEGEKKSKELEFKRYHSNDVLAMEGKFYKGERIFEWKFYNQYGTLTRVTNYAEGALLDGESKDYFDNGQLKIKRFYKDDKAEGYFVQYYHTGAKYSEGYFSEGDLVGEWIFYNEDGSVESTQYYLGDEFHGDMVSYDSFGRKESVSRYYYGTFEELIDYDTTGQEIRRYQLKDGAAKFDYVDMNGKPTGTSEYVGAERNGEMIRYYANGQVQVKGNYIDGKQDGEWVWYNRDGVKVTEGKIDMGEKSGIWKWYHDNGKLKLEGEYLKGMEMGVHKRYYRNGNIETEKAYRYGERHGTSTYYDPSGEVQYMRYYQDGIQEGYSYLGKDGKPVEMVKFNNEEGAIECYFKSGVKSYYSEYKDGLIHGKTIYYHANGKVADQRNYKKDYFDGKFVEYQKDGKVIVEANYVDGDLQGEMKEYWPNGKLKKEEYYVQDELNGWATYYKEDGSLKEKVYFYDGRQLK